MCLFCAAVPMTVSLSIAAKAELKQKRKKVKALRVREPQFTGLLAKMGVSVVGMPTAILLVVLMVGAIVYHTTILPRTGV